MKIYLAGPDVFEQDPIGKGEELKALCRKYGAEGLFPLDNEISDTENGSISQAKAIRAANMALIHSCDAVLANMTPFRGPSMDVGTAYEMGAGAALGKIVVGYMSNHDSYVEKVRALHKTERDADGLLRDERQMFVEDFKSGGVGLVDNLMISCGVEKLCRTAEEAIQEAVAIFRARKGAK